MSEIENASLGQKVEVISGTHVESDKVSNDPSKTPYLTGPNDFEEVGFTITKYTEDPPSFCESGDTLVTVKGSGCGKSTFATERAAISRQLKALRPMESLDPKYLYYWIQTQEERLSILAQGTSIPGLSISDLTTLQIQLPTYPEQQCIADILSTVDEQIQQTDEIIEETKRLKTGLMQDLLTRGIDHETYEERYLGPQKIEVPEEWTKARLEDVSEIITRGKQPTYVEEGGVPVLNQSCIYWDGYHPEELKRLDEEVAAGWKDKYWIKEGDVLINSTGKGTLGRALEWTQESDTHALDSHITRVHPDESVLDPTYFRFYLESNHG